MVWRLRIWDRELVVIRFISWIDGFRRSYDCRMPERILNCRKGTYLGTSKYCSYVTLKIYVGPSSCLVIRVPQAPNFFSFQQQTSTIEICCFPPTMANYKSVMIDLMSRCTLAQPPKLSLHDVMMAYNWAFKVCQEDSPHFTASYCKFKAERYAWIQARK